jgi:hypothetical protein
MVLHHPEPALTVLCQPDPGKSCGACCGLYNYADSSRSSLCARLRQRTLRFKKTITSGRSLKDFAQETLSLEDFRKRYEVIYCCEYLGFLDGEEKRVGCLLHPALNSGVDRREVSFYGQELCAGHLCPSHQYLQDNHKKILVKIIDDWYLYGLCLTDIDLVRTYFRLLSDGVGEEITAIIFENAELKACALEFFSWKVAWPFHSQDSNRLGKYYFDGSEYMISRIDYERLGRQLSAYQAIFLSLCSFFRNGEDLDQAEELIRQNLEKFIGVYLHKG